MRFQTDDIIKRTGGLFLKVQGILGNKVLTGTCWRDIAIARCNKVIDAIFTEADLAKHIIVERDGKPYEPEKWAPKEGEAYYYPDTNKPDLWEVIPFKHNHRNDKHRRDNGLCYPYTDEGQDAAIAHAKRMLAVK